MRPLAVHITTSCTQPAKMQDNLKPHRHVSVSGILAHQSDLMLLCEPVRSTLMRSESSIG